MISQHTAEILEYPKIIALIKERCVTAYGPPEVDQFKRCLTARRSKPSG